MSPDLTAYHKSPVRLTSTTPPFGIIPTIALSVVGCCLMFKNFGHSTIPMLLYLSPTEMYSDASEVNVHVKLKHVTARVILIFLKILLVQHSIVYLTFRLKYSEVRVEASCLVNGGNLFFEHVHIIDIRE